MTWRRCVRSCALQCPRRRWRTNHTTDPFITVSSLRKRVFSREFPERKEQNQSGAGSMRRWKAVVDCGAKTTASTGGSWMFESVVADGAVKGWEGGRFTGPF